MNLIIRDITENDTKQLKKFKCGNTSMEVFLFEEAYIRHRLGEGITKLLIDEDNNELIAYYTLKCDVMKIDEPEMYEVPREIPCIEISRLAVANRWQDGEQGVNIGTKLMYYIIDLIYEISKIIGCRYITLHSVIERVEWYKKFRFEVLQIEEVNCKPNTAYMYFDLSNIGK